MFRSFLACYAYLVPGGFTLPDIIENEQIELIIRGNFGKYPRMADSVNMLGQREKLDVYSPKLNYLRNRYNKKIFSSCHIYALIDTSKKSDDFQIDIYLSLFDSWIDIIVYQTCANFI